MADPQIVKDLVSESGPFASQNFWPTVWMVAVSMLGGAASFAQKLKAGEARAFNVMELTGELLISGFVGLCTFWLCKSNNIDPYITAISCGVAGHMGTRAIAIFEKALASRFGLKDDGSKS